MRRPNPSFFISLGIHTALIAAVMHVGFGSGTWLHFSRDAELKPTQETVRYVAIRGRVASVPVVGREGGDGIPEREPNAEPAPLPPAPVTVPNAIPAAPMNSASAATPSGRGPLVGRGGPLRGIEPAYTDPRVWAELDPGPVVKLTKKERVDSVIADIVGAHNDSLAIAQANKGRDGSDWTVEKGGQKWGVDSRFIRLGPVSIPLALLGLLPMNNAGMQGNVLAAERSRQQNAWSREIAAQAQRSLNEDEFRVAVKRLRERKEKERQQKRGDGTTVAGPSGM